MSEDVKKYLFIGFFTALGGLIGMKLFNKVF